MKAHEMWELFKEQHPDVKDTYEAWQFGDDPDKLADLVLKGIKTATCSGYLWYELENEKLPEIDEYSIVLNSQDEAVCIIKTIKVYLKPFDEMTELHAYKEGEGDRSLEYWKEVHRRFFTEELNKINQEFDVKMMLVCEEFEVVYRDPVIEMMNFLHLAEKMKTTYRHSECSDRSKESVAEHSHRLSLMAMLIKDQFPDIDHNKLVRMCIVHDLGESITTDIPTFEKTDDHEKTEVLAQNQIIEMLSGSVKQEFKELFDEINALETKEAKIYKCLDKLEAVIQHNEASLDSWIELEYELNVTYGTKECSQFEFMKKWREAVREDTIRKLEEGK